MTAQKKAAQAPRAADNASGRVFTPRFLALSEQGFRPVGAPLATRGRMKEALCSLFTLDPATRAAFGREGRAFVESHHSLEREAADCAALYRRLLSARTCKYLKTLIVAPDCRRPGALSALEGLVRAWSTPLADASNEASANASADTRTASANPLSEAEEVRLPGGDLAIWGDPSLAPFFPGVRVIPRGFAISHLPLFLSLRHVVALPDTGGAPRDGKILRFAAKLKKPIAYWGLSAGEGARIDSHSLPGKQKTLVVSSLTPPKDEPWEVPGQANKEKTLLRFAPPPALFLPPWEKALGLRREEEKRPFCLFLLDLSPWGSVAVTMPPAEGANPAEKARKKASFYLGASFKEAAGASLTEESGLVPYTAPVFQPDWREKSRNEQTEEGANGGKSRRKSAGKEAGGKEAPVMHTAFPLRAFFENNRKGREEGIAFFAKLALFASELGFRPLFLLPNGAKSDEKLKELLLAVVGRCEKAAPVIRVAAPGEEAALAKEAAFAVTTYEDGLWHAAAAGTPLLYLSASPNARAAACALPSAALLSPFCHTSAVIGARERKKAGRHPARPIPPKKPQWDSTQGLSDAKEAIFALLFLGQENKTVCLESMRAQKEAFVSAAKAVRADLAFFDRQRALAKRRRARKKKKKGSLREPVSGSIPGSVPGSIPGCIPGAIPPPRKAQEGTP